MMRRLTLAVCLVVVAAVAPSAGASPRLQVGVVDNQEALGNPDRLFPVLSTLSPQVLRFNLYWGGRLGVARRRKPVNAADPSDPAYDWGIYDRAILAAADHGIRVALSIFGTPSWANGGNEPSFAPRDEGRLEEFAYAAATRYSGYFLRPDGVVLPAVRLWIAWNEPNLRLGLIPQWRRVGGRWRIESARNYARICNAIYRGVHWTLLRDVRVACGVTSARGNNAPRTKRPSTAPIGFLRAMKAAGAVTFDAYAHQPYSPAERPSRPPRNRSAVTLGNIDKLAREVTRLYGPKPIWITEYGYETAPPDSVFGVSWQRQARYLEEAFAIARRHPRIDLMLWFLVRDEVRLRGWQSGFISSWDRRKPAFWAFQRVAALAHEASPISSNSFDPSR